jgi:hypothetical protein
MFRYIVPTTSFVYLGYGNDSVQKVRILGAKTPTFWPPRRAFRKSFIINNAASWFVQGFLARSFNLFKSC